MSTRRKVTSTQGKRSYPTSIKDRLSTTLLEYLCLFLPWSEGVRTAQIFKCKRPLPLEITAKDYEVYELKEINLPQLLKRPNEKTIFIPHVTNYMCTGSMIYKLYNSELETDLIWQCGLCKEWSKLNFIRIENDGYFYHGISTLWIEDDKRPQFRKMCCHCIQHCLEFRIKEIVRLDPQSETKCKIVKTYVYITGNYSFFSDITEEEYQARVKRRKRLKLPNEFGEEEEEKDNEEEKNAEEEENENNLQVSDGEEN
jgi:hypothetical protein